MLVPFLNYLLTDLIALFTVPVAFVPLLLHTCHLLRVVVPGSGDMKAKRPASCPQRPQSRGTRAFCSCRVACLVSDARLQGPRPHPCALPIPSSSRLRREEESTLFLEAALRSDPYHCSHISWARPRPEATPSCKGRDTWLL